MHSWKMPLSSFIYIDHNIIFGIVTTWHLIVRKITVRNYSTVLLIFLLFLLFNRNLISFLVAYISTKILIFYTAIIIFATFHLEVRLDIVKYFLFVDQKVREL